MFDYDAEIRRYHELFLPAMGIGSEDHVLDIGCGAGQSTRDAARAGAAALGVDVSELMLELAQRRAAEEGVRNVRFELADAQRHPFPANEFDIVISRFGTMFFDDPAAAFTNIGRALRPAGRLVMLVWQARDDQEWAVVIRDALGDELPAGDPFSLADPATVHGVLGAAGFTEVELIDLREPIYYGPDAHAAYDAVLNLRMAKDPLARLGEDDRRRALERLRTALAMRETKHGVWFDSRVWLITAQRP